MKTLPTTLAILVCLLVACSGSADKAVTAQATISPSVTVIPRTSGIVSTATSHPTLTLASTQISQANTTATETPASIPTCPPHSTVTASPARTAVKQIEAQWITGVFVSESRVGPDCLSYYRLFRFLKNGKVISTFAATADISKDWPLINEWFYAGNREYKSGPQYFSIAETFEGTYTLQGGEIQLEIWQRVLFVDREVVSVGDHWYQTYKGIYWGDKLLFDYYDREGVVYDSDGQSPSDVYEYEYTRLDVAGE